MAGSVRPDLSRLQKSQYWGELEAIRKREGTYEERDQGVRRLRSLAREASDKGDRDLEGNCHFIEGVLWQNIEPPDHGAALRAFSEASRVFPNWPEPVFNSGVSLTLSGKHSAAIEAYDKAEGLFRRISGDLNESVDFKLLNVLGRIALFRAESSARLGPPEALTRTMRDVAEGERLLKRSRGLAKDKGSREDENYATRWLDEIPGRMRQALEAFGPGGGRGSSIVRAWYVLGFILGAALTAWLVVAAVTRWFH